MCVILFSKNGYDIVIYDGLLLVTEIILQICQPYRTCKLPREFYFYPLNACSSILETIMKKKFSFSVFRIIYHIILDNNIMEKKGSTVLLILAFRYKNLYEKMLFEAKMIKRKSKTTNDFIFF